MSGVQIAIALLSADPAAAGFAAPRGPIAGILPQGTAPPAYGVETISELDHDVLDEGGSRFVRERVQVTAIAPDYATAHDMIKAAKNALCGKFPAIAGFANIDVSSAGGGPSGLHYATKTPARTYDFMVAYEEPVGAASSAFAAALDVIDPEGNHVALTLEAADGDGNLFELG